MLQKIYLQNKRKKKEQAPKLITTKLSSSSTENNNNRNSSVTGDDIEAAFDSINDYRSSKNKAKEPEITPKPDSLFGLSTIRENFDTDETIVSPKHQTDDEIDNYFNTIKQTNEEKKPKKTAPVIPQTKSTKEQKRSTPSHYEDIHTPATSISVKVDNTPTSSTTLPTKNQSDDKNDSTDEDVDEIIGKLEVSLSGKYTHTYIHYFPIFYLLKHFLFIISNPYNCMYVCSVFSYEKLSVRKKVLI